MALQVGAMIENYAKITKDATFDMAFRTIPFSKWLLSSGRGQLPQICVKFQKSNVGV